jgi:hypothetical protein
LQALVATCTTVAGCYLKGYLRSASIEGKPLIVVQNVVGATWKRLLDIVVVNGTTITVKVKAVGLRLWTSAGGCRRAGRWALGLQQVIGKQKDGQCNQVNFPHNAILGQVCGFGPTSLALLEGLSVSFCP